MTFVPRHPEHQYLDLLRDILERGTERMDRTGVGTKSLFGAQIRFDLSKGFPLFTTKKVWFKGIVHELLWLLSGDTNIRYLKENGVGIWDEWADKDGNLGPVYGQQWRSWTGFQRVEADCFYSLNGGEKKVVDQIATVIQNIKTNPHDRGHIVSAWNVADLDKMALRPCHTMFQFYVADGKLSCQLYQRSADAMLGLPFNTASYSLLTMMIAQCCGLALGDFVHTFGDLHIYKSHYFGAVEQMTREPHPFPRVELDTSIKEIDDFKFEHVKLVDYKSHPAIKMEVAV